MCTVGRKLQLSVQVQLPTASAATVATVAAVTQAPSEPIEEPAAVVVEEKTTVVVTKAQTESFSQGMFETNSTELSTDGKIALMPIVEVLQRSPSINS